MSNKTKQEERKKQCDTITNYATFLKDMNKDFPGFYFYTHDGELTVFKTDILGKKVIIFLFILKKFFSSRLFKIS